MAAMTAAEIIAIASHPRLTQLKVTDFRRFAYGSGVFAKIGRCPIVFSVFWFIIGEDFAERKLMQQRDW